MVVLLSKITLPYSKVFTANAYTNYILTLLLCNPSSLEWHFILLQAALQIILSYMVHGLLFARIITSPRYLNSFTVSAYFSPIFNILLQLMYMAFVFLTFVCKSFSLQNCTKQSIRSCNSVGEGASRTKSSAKDSKNINTDANVYARLLLPCILCFL